MRTFTTLFILAFMVAPVLAPAQAAAPERVFAGLIEGHSRSSSCGFQTSAQAPLSIQVEPTAPARVTAVVKVMLSRERAGGCMPGALEAGFVIEMPTGNLTARTYAPTYDPSIIADLELTVETQLSAGESVTYPTVVYLRVMGGMPTNISVSRGSITIATTDALLPFG